MTNNNKFIYNTETFTKENDISYYLLGVFITDGNVSEQKSSKSKKYYSCEIKSADHDWLKDLSKKCGDNLILKKAENSNCLRLRLHSTFIGEWLVSKGCVPNKTLKIQFPNIPEQYLPDFIRGCWDGDGSLSLVNRANKKSEAKAQLYSASQNFIYSLQSTLETRLNITAPIYKVKMQDHLMINGNIISAKNQLYQMSISGKNCKTLVECIYYKGHSLSLRRKRDKSEEIIKRYS